MDKTCLTNSSLCTVVYNNTRSGTEFMTHGVL